MQTRHRRVKEQPVGLSVADAVATETEPARRRQRARHATDVAAAKAAVMRAEDAGRQVAQYREAFRRLLPIPFR